FNERGEVIGTKFNPDTIRPREEDLLIKERDELSRNQAEAKVVETPAEPQPAQPAQPAAIQAGSRYESDLAAQKATKPGEQVQSPRFTEEDKSHAQGFADQLQDRETLEDSDGGRWQVQVTKSGSVSLEQVGQDGKPNGFVKGVKRNGKYDREGLEILSRSKREGGQSAQPTEPVPISKEQPTGGETNAETEVVQRPGQASEVGQGDNLAETRSEVQKPVGEVTESGGGKSEPASPTTDRPEITDQQREKLGISKRDQNAFNAFQEIAQIFREERAKPIAQRQAEFGERVRKDIAERVDKRSPQNHPVSSIFTDNQYVAFKP